MRSSRSDSFIGGRVWHDARDPPRASKSTPSIAPAEDPLVGRRGGHGHEGILHDTH